MAVVSFKRGTKPEELTSLNADTLYFFTDTHEIYLGQQRYSSDVESIAEDISSVKNWMTTHKQEYTELEGRVQILEKVKPVTSVTAADKSITVAGETTTPTVQVALSEDPKNKLTLETDGLAVKLSDEDLKDYTVTVSESTDDPTYAKVYTITQESTSLSAKINIPKDLVVASGSVKTNPDEDHTGTFIELVLSDEQASKIYIDVKDLIEYVHVGEQTDSPVQLTIGDDYAITATIKDGSVTKTMLETSVQTTLTNADTAYACVTWGEISA